MLKSHTIAMSATPRTIGREMSNPPPLTDQLLLENHSAWMSVPATRPLTDSTTDQPIQ